MTELKHLILLWLADYDTGFVYIEPGDEWEYISEVFPKPINGVIVPNDPTSDTTQLERDLWWTLIDISDGIHQASYL